jgi:hypothetical protein
MKRFLQFMLYLSLVACFNVQAQAPSDQPPQLQDLTEGEEPAITQRKKESVQPQTEQTIQNGEQTEVRVTNDIGTYIVKPNQSVGNSLPGDAQSSSNNPAQWIVKSWGNNPNTDPTAAPPTAPAHPDNTTSK